MGYFNRGAIGDQTEPKRAELICRAAHIGFCLDRFHRVRETSEMEKSKSRIVERLKRKQK